MKVEFGTVGDCCFISNITLERVLGKAISVKGFAIVGVEGEFDKNFFLKKKLFGTFDRILLKLRGFSEKKLYFIFSLKRTIIEY